MKLFPLLLIVFLCLAPREGKSQLLKAMGKGLPHKAECACLDSTGRAMYVFTRSDKADSIEMYLWDSSISNSWTGPRYLKGNFGPVVNKVTCQSINGRGTVVTGVNPGSNHTYIYNFDISSGYWAQVASVSHSGPDYFSGEIKAYKFFNKVYFAGHFDSFAGIANPGIVEYDGANFRGTGMSTTPVERGFNLDSRNDTLFFARGNKLYIYQRDSLSWSTYYTLTKGKILGFGINGSSIYMNGNGKIWRHRYGALDSIPSDISQPVYSKVSNKLLIGERLPYGQPGAQGIFSISQGFAAEKLARLSTIDTSDLKFINIGTHIYVYGRQGVRYNGIDYGNMAELVSGSLLPQKVDSVYVWIFRDQDGNGVYDPADSGSSSYIAETNTGLQYLTDARGKIAFYPLNNEDLKFQFLSEATDSCYKSPFSGATGSRHYNSVRGNDTVMIPVTEPKKGAFDFVVNSYAARNARMDQDVKLKFRVFERDCKTDSSTVTMVVALDPNVLFQNASPPFTSRSGNTLTYTMRLDPKAPREFEVTVNYPSAKFNLNQVVKHYSSISSQVPDDSSGNMDSILQIMVNSYDPNCKHSVPEGRVTTDVDRIRYIIEFQNEGNDDAWKVRIVDTLNLKMPVYEFRMVAASHPYTVSHRGNEITWMFDNIFLKPKSVSEEASKGYLVFDAMVKGELRQGDSITNNAYIFFDYNKPVVTNNNVIIRQDGQGGVPFQSRTRNLGLYPNPGNDYITVENKTPIARSIYLYDARGALMGQVWVSPLEHVTVDTTGWAAGIYIAADHLGESLRFIIE